MNPTVATVATLAELRPLFLRVGYTAQGLLLLMHFAPKGVFGLAQLFLRRRALISPRQT